MGWPSDEELGQFLVGAKVCKTVPSSVDGAIEATVQRLEEVSGWSPFLSDGEAVTKLMTPPDDGYLWLPCGFLSVASVYTGVSSTSTGTLLVADQDYQLLPDNALDVRAPYDRIKSSSFAGGAVRSVSVTGITGRMSESDPRFKDVAFWVLRGAAASVYFEATGQPGTVKRLRQGPVDIEYSDSQDSIATAWDAGFESMACRYRRIVV